MPVEKKGHKGSSPKVSQYYKVDNDKVSRERKHVLDVERVSLCQNIRIEEPVANVAIQNLFNKVFFFVI